MSVPALGSLWTLVTQPQVPATTTTTTPASEALLLSHSCPLCSSCPAPLLPPNPGCSPFLLRPTLQYSHCSQHVPPPLCPVPPMASPLLLTHKNPRCPHPILGSGPSCTLHGSPGTTQPYHQGVDFPSPPWPVQPKGNFPLCSHSGNAGLSREACTCVCFYYFPKFLRAGLESPPPLPHPGLAGETLRNPHTAQA